jgi:hypothetical protein
MNENSEVSGTFVARQSERAVGIYSVRAGQRAIENLTIAAQRLRSMPTFFSFFSPFSWQEG